MIRFASALPIVAVLVLFVFAVPASAQTANNLVCKGCVGTSDLGNNAVTGAKIKDGGIRAKDLGNDAKPAGADANETEVLMVLGAGELVIDSVTVSAPADGFVLVTANSNFTISSASELNCSISKNTSLDSSQLVYARNANTALIIVPVSATRMFAVSKGKAKFNFVCEVIDGGINMRNHSISAIFVPNHY